MEYIIASGESVEIKDGDKIKLVEEWAEKFPGFLVVTAALETYIEARTGKNTAQIFSPSLISEVVGEKKVNRADLKPVIREILLEILPGLMADIFRDDVRNRLTPAFFDGVAKDAVKATVKNEVGLALRQGANAIDPPAKAGK